MLSDLIQKIKIKAVFYNNEPILTSIMQDTFVGEAGEDEGVIEETTGGYFYRSGWKFFHCLALDFLSQNTHTCMHA